MKILLTGANGYIGRRLLPILVNYGHEVICLVRDKRRIEVETSLLHRITFFEADLLNPASLRDLPKDIEATYYLVHSMGNTSRDFTQMEADTAQNFIDALQPTTCQQIIYLSGIVNEEELSPHLRSRKNVEDILSASSIPLTVLRAAIIIGSGGASFEIIRDLVEKLPVMIAPKWLNTRCQPIAIRNVINYLEGVLGNEDAYDRIFDIGGPDILTYKEMLLRFAKVRGFKRWILTVPVLTPRLSSYWLYFVTSTSYILARSLVDSMIHEVVVQHKGIEEVVPQRLISYEDAVDLAFDKIAQNEVLSSWKDALASSTVPAELLDFVQIPTYGCFFDRKAERFTRGPSEVMENLWRLGGERGWYYWNTLWKIRGLMDKAVGGVGLRRGRRSPTQLIAGDALDFWRVLIASREEGRLLLYAEMRLPGEAWLEFRLKQNDDGSHTLHQVATFRPHGVWGRVYWYLVLPFHAFIFKGMLHRIITYKEKPSKKEKRTLPKKPLHDVGAF